MKNKITSKSQACAAKVLFAVMSEMKRRGGSIPTKEIYSFVENNVSLNDWEATRAGKMQYLRWQAGMQFYSIDYNKAGYIIKKNGFWYLTPEGEEALSMGTERLMLIASDLYRQWQIGHVVKEVVTPDDSNIEDIVAQSAELNLEDIEGKADSSIRDYICQKSPYEFQDMVAALLRAIGYYTPFIAPKGKDGGIDIIAYIDPLGAQPPRIKAQVKHKPDTSIAAADIRALIGVLRTGDIALFVTSGTFSSDARNVAINAKEYIRLIDGSEFISMWQEYYDKMPDDDKKLLPLKRIAFLGSNEN